VPKRVNLVHISTRYADRAMLTFTPLQKSLSTWALAASLVLLAWSGAWGQIRLGLRVMPQVNSLLNSQDSQNGVERRSTAGFSVGALIGYQFSPKYGVEINALFAQQGQTSIRRYGDVIQNTLFDTLKLYGLNPGSYYTETVNVTSIKIPILFTYSFISNPKAVFKISAGPQISIISAGDVIREFANHPAQQPDPKNPNKAVPPVPAVDYGSFAFGGQPFERFTGLEIAAVVGAGLDMPITKNLYFNVGLRVEYGLTDLDNKGATWQPAGQTTAVKYYDNYYGDGKARTASTNQLVIGAVIGVTFHLDSNKDPGRYRW